MLKTGSHVGFVFIVAQDIAHKGKDKIMPICGKKISGYVTVRNVVEMNYPIESCINSLIPVCDEIIVADSSDNTDGTSDTVQRLARENDKIKIFQVDVPWSDPNFGVYDGEMKAIARSQCSGDLLIQIDADEVLEDAYAQKLEKLIASGVFESNPIVALPVVEYWGSKDKVRIDVNPWKWRVSVNNPNITHGIPMDLRKEINGYLYSKPGSDGCDYVHVDTGERLPFANFISQEINQLRMSAITNPQHVALYEQWFNTTVEEFPTVYHFSWWSITEKIKKFTKFWNKSWLSLYGEDKKISEGWNPFFPEYKFLEDVPEEKIEELAHRLAAETGGHIFHNPWTGNKTNHVVINQPLPSYIQEWAQDNKQS